MPDILVQSEALVLLQNGVTIKADVELMGDTRENGHYVRRDPDLIRVRPSNWAGADWTEVPPVILPARESQPGRVA